MATPTTANRQIAQAAGTIMVAFSLSQAIGLVRSILITATFGTGRIYDAFVVANTYPNALFSLIAGGALASAFVPTFTSLITKKDLREAWQLASAVTNLVLIFLSVLSLVSAICAPLIVRFILAPQWPAEQQALSANLLRILLLTPAVFGVSGLVMGILNSHQRFLLPALAPAMYGVGMILGLLLFVPSMGIYGLAWGAVLGASLHLLVQLPDLFRLSGQAYSPTLGLHSPPVREVIRLMGPRLLGVATVQINSIVNNIIATGPSQLPGAPSAISTAFMVMMLPEAAIAQSIAIAVLPTFSAQAARGEMDELRSSLAATLRGLLLLAVPASVGLILLRQPIVATVFQHGEFTPQNTSMVAWALLWYAAGLVGHSMVEVLVRAFYALHDTKTPVLIGSIAMGLNVLLSLGLSTLFTALGWMPHGGLALANSLATALEMAALLVFMRRRLGGLQGRLVLDGLIQAAAASAGMGLVLWGWMRLTQSTSVYWVSIGGVLLGGGVYSLGMLIQRVPELGQLFAAVHKRVLKKSENGDMTHPG
ncbi:MAG TPA: murein biosynthesis integral membrane protein MurJ [Anaerolineaceae bacterium]|nr:murein biosynthesis integral membrane protein MurJ [Anaerolineaceae bacterium]